MGFEDSRHSLAPHEFAARFSGGDEELRKEIQQALRWQWIKAQCFFRDAQVKREFTDGSGDKFLTGAVQDFEDEGEGIEDRKQMLLSEAQLEILRGFVRSGLLYKLLDLELWDRNPQVQAFLETEYSDEEMGDFRAGHRGRIDSVLEKLGVEIPK